MRKLGAVALALTTMITLAACGSGRSDGFKDEEEKKAAYNRMNCEMFHTWSPEGIRDHMFRLGMFGDSTEKKIADATISRINFGATMNDLLPVEDDGTCVENWLYSYEVSRVRSQEDYDSFTAENAKIGGYLRRG